MVEDRIQNARIQNSECRGVRKQKYPLIFLSLLLTHPNFFKFLDQKPCTFFDPKKAKIFTDKGFDS